MNESTDYKVSDTTLESEWISNGIWNNHYCKNCKYVTRYKAGAYEHGYRKYNYCPKCGARMKNPGYVGIECEEYN